MSITRLPVLFLTDLVVLPGMVVPIELDDAARAAVDTAKAHSDGALLVAPRLEDRYASYGVVAEIVQLGRLATGQPAAVIKAERRVKIGSGVYGPGTALWVEAEELPQTADETDEIQKLAAEYKGLVIATLQRRDAWQVIDTVNRVTDPSTLGDLAGDALWLSDERKRELVETPDVVARLTTLIEWTKAYIAETEVNDKIADDVREGMEKSQREFLLRQQLNAIRKELGEDEPDGAQDYRARVEEAALPDEVRKAALREVGKLERASDQSPESGWIRTWLDTILELPWNTKTSDSTDIDAAREVLDADHHGLEDVKDRIVEYLAIRARRASRGLEVIGGRGSGAVMALVGPPGVGKTSLGESVARALGRKFVRVALGGIHDEAEIRGHRRTYVGAMLGRIVRALKDAGTKNPVMMLDEIDKVGADWRGDPSSALLEVLDPAQNHTFRDHYLDVDLDLSEVLFVATGNVAETIPGPLLDRMEVLRLDGYTEDEKVAIARHHLMPRQIERNGLREDEVRVTDDALREVVASYTREAGVRNLERELGKTFRKVATKLAGGDTVAPVVVDRDDVRGYLGRQRFSFEEMAERTSVPGVATGLAVTGTGGDVLFIEATREDEGEGLTLTGQLGDVMKESAQIALSFVRSHATELGIEPGRLTGRFHVHVPAGAVPKDGPSAGVTMTTALVSLLTGETVRPVVGMTGEVTLQGRVLPIGGVKQKVLAAHRAGLTEVILPTRNEGDLDDVPEQVREEMTFHLSEDAAEVLTIALGPASAEVPDRAPSAA